MLGVGGRGRDGRGGGGAEEAGCVCGREGGGVDGARQTPSIAFRHLPPTLNDFVNLCLEFGGRVEWGGWRGGGGGGGRQG